MQALFIFFCHLTIFRSVPPPPPPYEYIRVSFWQRLIVFRTGKILFISSDNDEPSTKGSLLLKTCFWLAYMEIKRMGNVMKPWSNFEVAEMGR